MKILVGFSILFVCLLLISAIPTASALEIINVEGDYVNEQVKITLDKPAFVIFRMNNGTPIYAQGAEVYFIPRVKGELYIEALAGEERATELVSIVEKQSNDGGDDGYDGDTPNWIKVTLEPGSFNVTATTFSDPPFKEYTVDRLTPLGALDKSGKSYKVTDKWIDMGLFVYSIEEKSSLNDDGEPKGTEGWNCWVNDKLVFPSVDKYELRDGAIVHFFWGSSSATPYTSSDVISRKVRILSPANGWSNGSNRGNSISPTPTPMPTQIVEEAKTIEFIEAGGNASLTFNKTEITGIAINANNTIRNAEVTIQQIEKPANITNVSGISYCYFNITTTNLTATDITNATIEFKVNKTWLNESNIDETTITLNRYSDIKNNWSALPTSKIEENNASLYFESETPGFSLFAVSGEKKTVSMATTEAPTAEATAIPVPLPKVTPVSSTPTPIPLSTHIHRFPGSLILIVIAVIVIVGIIIAVVLKRKK